MNRSRLVYVLAASHSGSTLTAMLLGAHAQTHTVGELKLNSIGDVREYRCSCRESILNCGFWAKIGRRMSELGEPFDLAEPAMDYYLGSSKYIQFLERPLYRGGMVEFLRTSFLRASGSWRRHISKVQRRNATFIRAVLDVSGATALVDSSKIGSRLIHLLSNSNIDVFVVRVVRDGRAVALTYMDPENFADASRPNFRGGGVGKSRENEVLSIEAAANEWRRSNEEAEAVLKKVRSDKQAVLRYEELCDDPVRSLNSVFRKMGLKPIDKVPKFRTANPHIVGNGMRMDTSETIKLDDRWRTKLSVEELNRFDQIAGDLNRKLGYR